jgi:hypothetical protein
MFQKNEDLGKRYNKENKRYIILALGKPIKYKGIYFCRLDKGKVEYFDVTDELDDPKIIIQNNSKNFIILYNFEENPC